MKSKKKLPKRSLVDEKKEMSEDNLNNNNNNMEMPVAGRESLEMVKTVGTGESLASLIFTKMMHPSTESYWRLQSYWSFQMMVSCTRC